MENFVDAGLLGHVSSGNREAIRAMCKLAAEHVAEMRARCGPGHDDLTPFVLSALNAIAAGTSPDAAFGWKQKKRGRQHQNHSLRDWMIRTEVLERMKVSDQSLTIACESISAGTHDEDIGHGLSETKIRNICKGMTKKSVSEPPPSDPFPIHSARSGGR